MILSRAFAPSEREQTVVALSLCVLEYLMIDAIYIHLFEIIKNTVTIDCLSFGSMDGVWMEIMHRRVCMLLCRYLPSNLPFDIGAHPATCYVQPKTGRRIQSVAKGSTRTDIRK